MDIGPTMGRRVSSAFFPLADRAKTLDFISTGKNIRSAARHAEMVTAHNNPATRTGTKDDAIKTRKAAISITFARIIGFPVRNIVCHILQLSSWDSEQHWR